jgi:hypothetical protein
MFSLLAKEGQGRSFRGTNLSLSFVEYVDFL